MSTDYVKHPKFNWSQHASALDGFSSQDRFLSSSFLYSLPTQKPISGGTPGAARYALKLYWYSYLHAEFDEIRKINIDIVVVGKTAVDNDKEDFDNDADDDDVDNAEESEGDDFEQETG
ncbi:hypothetical protein MKW94_016663 [Papaver nudicaule]|uniref:Uncharacterized protein n=1 Tax=Papaver nudicaule TaxID=74823 RepID=A0AA41UZ88_PAPNU|nr:hypothetical protein [Papaver nudicaule]